MGIKDTLFERKRVISCSKHPLMAIFDVLIDIADIYFKT